MLLKFPDSINWRVLGMSTQDAAQHRLYLNKTHVGTVVWSATQARTGGKVWKVTCTLPGVKQRVGYFAQCDHGRTALLARLNNWLKRTGLG